MRRFLRLVPVLALAGIIYVVVKGLGHHYLLFGGDVVISGKRLLVGLLFVFVGAPSLLLGLRSAEIAQERILQAHYNNPWALSGSKRLQTFLTVPTMFGLAFVVAGAATVMAGGQNVNPAEYDANRPDLAADRTVCRELGKILNEAKNLPPTNDNATYLWSRFASLETLITANSSQDVRTAAAAISAAKSARDFPRFQTAMSDLARTCDRTFPLGTE